MSGRASYKVLKVLNNNVILAKSLITKQEMILIGKGIGFQSKAGNEVDIPAGKIEKSFLAYDRDTKAKYLDIINKLDGEVIGIGEEIITMAETKLGALDSHVHIALTDHIAFAIERLGAGMDIANPFLEEIKILYAEEYELGIEAAKLIRERLNINFPDEEIGFIAIHIHAARQNKKVSDTVRYTSLIKHLIELVEDNLEIQLNPLDLSYTRLVNHLRYSILRMENGETVNNPLLLKIKEDFAESFKLATKMANYIEDTLKNLNLSVSEDEIAYIALHLHRLKIVSN